jgi:hypothetical protein
MNAYRCDGCLNYKTGEPAYTITPLYRMMQDPEEWHACTPGCLVLAAESIAALGLPRTDTEETP